MAIQAITKPAADGIAIEGARIFFTIHMPIQDLPITESQINTWLVIISLFFLCLYFTHGLTEDCKLKRQLIAEWIVEKTDALVKDNMGEYFKAFSPFVAGIMALSVFSSLQTLIGLYPPTSDMNVVAGWAVLVFILITYYKLKGGFLNYLKGFTQPVPVLTPFNVISEFATPVSMSFRHYGNVLSGSVISVLVASGLQIVSHAVLGWIPGKIGEFPLFQIGIPAVLSLYFDLFSGCMQAFIFAMLTMLYVSGAFPVEEWQKRMAKKKNKKQNKQKA
ncbi:MAG: F0F1 ATP synthase subunit A [Ruminococcus sp.]|nr:F0F1 ATP synthase subunit A [Candidatus Copronaster equi]